MTVMFNTETYPNGDPIAHKKVLLRLWTSPAYSDEMSYEAIGEVKTDEDGYWELALEPTNALVPTGQIYLAEIVFRGGTIQHRFTVPDVSLSAEWIGDWLADPPGALETAALAAHLLDPTAHAGTQHPDLAAHDLLGLVTEDDLAAAILGIDIPDVDLTSRVAKAGDTMTGMLTLSAGLLANQVTVQGSTAQFPPSKFGQAITNYTIRNSNAPVPVKSLYNFVAEATYSDSGVLTDQFFYVADMVSGFIPWSISPSQIDLYGPLKIEPAMPGSTIASVLFTIKGRPAQTGDLIQLKDSAGVNQLSVTTTGLLSTKAADFTDLTGGVTLTTRSAWSGATKHSGLQSSAFQAYNFGTGGAALLNPYYAYGANYGTGLVDRVIGLWIEGSDGPGLVTNGYAIKIESWAGGNFTNPPYAIHSAGPMRSLLGGPLEVHGTATGVGLTVKGAAGSFVDQAQWQDSAGTIVARMFFNGALRVPYMTVVNSLSTGYVGDVDGFGPYFELLPDKLTVYPGATTQTPLTIKGMAAQTGDLIQLKNSAGSILLSVGGDGRTTVTGPFRRFRGVSGSGIVDSNWSSGASLHQLDGGAYYGDVYLSIGNNFYSLWQEYAKTRSTNGTTNAILQSGDELGRFNFSGDSGSAMTLGAAIIVSVDGVPVAGKMPSKISLFTASLTTSTVERLSIDSEGRAVFGSTVSAANPTSAAHLTTKSWVEAAIAAGGGGGAAAPLTLTAPLATDIPLIVKGAVAQSANLQEWQDSSGVANVRIGSNGTAAFINQLGFNVTCTPGYPMTFVGLNRFYGNYSGDKVMTVDTYSYAAPAAVALDILLSATQSANAFQIRTGGAVPVTALAVTNTGVFQVANSGVEFNAYNADSGSSTAGTIKLNTALEFSFSRPVSIAQITSPSAGPAVKLALTPASVELWAGTAQRVRAEIDHITILPSASGSLIIQPNAAATENTQEWRSTGGVAQFAVTLAGKPKWSTAAMVQTTVGAAGGADAPPATPTKYLKVVGDDGVTYVVPAYASA